MWIANIRGLHWTIQSPHSGRKPTLAKRNGSSTQTGLTPAQAARFPVSWFRDSGRMLFRSIPQPCDILTGTNDIYSMDSPPWQIDGDSPVHDTTTDIKSMVAMARSAGIKVVLGTIPPWGPGGLAAKADPLPVHWANILTLNQWIRDYGLANSIPVADYWSVLVSSDQKTYIPALTFDSVHPSSQGYAVMTPLTLAGIAQAEVTLQQLE